MVSEGSFVKLLFDPLPCHMGQTRADEENVRIVELCTTCDFLATVVAMHSTLVSDLLDQSFELAELRGLQTCFPTKRKDDYDEDKGSPLFQKWMNFRKISERPLTLPPPLFRKISLRFFPQIHYQNYRF